MVKEDKRREIVREVKEDKPRIIMVLYDGRACDDYGDIFDKLI